MTKLMQSALMLCVALSVAACGGQQEAAPAAPPAESSPVTEAPAAVEAPAAEAPAETMPEEAAPAPAIDGAVKPADPAPSDENHTKLLGTKWEIGDFKLEFKDTKTVHLNGGQLTMLTAGQGLDATYTFKDGKLTVSAMGQTREGTWDGEKLVFDGTEGTAIVE